MVYYYKPDLEDSDYLKKDQTAWREKKRDEAIKFLPQIKAIFPDLKIDLIWTQKRTFGWIFSDFEKTHKGRTIGRGEIDLYKMLKDEYVCVILSDKIGDDFSEENEIAEGKILRLNFTTFRNYLSMFGKTSDVVKAFLQGAFPSEIQLEQLQDRMEKGKAIDKKRTLEKFLDFIETYPLEKIDDLKLLIDKVPKLPKNLKLSSEQVSKLLTFINSNSENIQLSSQNFSKFLEVISKTNKIEFNDEDAAKMIGMLDRFAKTYHIKKRDDLEKVLNSVINFLEESQVTQPTDFHQLLGIVKKITTHYEIKSSEDFVKIMELCKISNLIISSNYDYFREKLEEFKNLIDDNTTSEMDIQNFITEHRWLLDFKFWAYDEIDNEKMIPNIGRIDLYMAKKEYKIKHIAIVEFKKPDLNVTDTRYRINKPVLTKGAVSALNQTMHYMENIAREPYSEVEGWVIVGRKSTESDYFVEVFNKYLIKGISTMTFQDLYNKAKDIIDAFVNPK